MFLLTVHPLAGRVARIGTIHFLGYAPAIVPVRKRLPHRFLALNFKRGPWFVCCCLAVDQTRVNEYSIAM